LIGDYQASDYRLKRGAALTRLRNAALDFSAMDAEGGESLTANATISLLFDGHNYAEFKKPMSTAREIVAEAPVNFIAVDNTKVLISSHRFFEPDASDRAFGSQIGVSLCSSASLAWLAERLSPPKRT
jgi:hypothetical protein